MMDRVHYEREGWAKITGVPFSEVRHPISNKPAFKEFDTLAIKIDFGKYIDLALLQANQSLEEQQQAYIEIICSYYEIVVLPSTKINTLFSEALWPGQYHT